MVLFSKNKFKVLLFLSLTTKAICADLLDHQWVHKIDDLSFRLNPPVFEKNIQIHLSKSQFKFRVKNSDQHSFIEPIYIRFNSSKNGLQKKSLEISKEKSFEEVTSFLNKNKIKMKTRGDKLYYQTKITEEILPSLNVTKIINKNSHSHHIVKFSNTAFRKNEKARRRLLSQLKPFFSSSKLRDLRNLIYSKPFLDLKEDLLPQFPKKTLGKFLAYKGPNCFHASLAFHSQVLTKSRFFNVAREKGYHPMMINYDELLRALKSNFYQVPHESSYMKYGDILVFFDIPEDFEQKPVDFRWIRHTATYLLSGYAFSKGSKSANSPYTIKTLQEEWNTWEKATKNLAVKLFRRNSKNVKDHPPKDLTDWIY